MPNGWGLGFDPARESQRTWVQLGSEGQGIQSGQEDPDPVLRKLLGHGNGRSRTGSMGEAPLGMVAQVGVGR